MFRGPFPHMLRVYRHHITWLLYLVALKDNPLINLLFQKREEIVRTFTISLFQFTIQQVDVANDVCLYSVKRGRFSVMMGFIGVDSWITCGKYSNVSFVHFIWQYFEQFGIRKHALTILPAPHTRASLSNRLRLLCLRHYRAASTRCNFYSACVACRDEFQEDLRPFTGCVAPGETCICRVCRRQLPSPKDMASDVVFSLVYNINRFGLTCDVTFDQYVYVVDSKRVEVWRLLPPDFPSITLEFQFEGCPLHKFHSHCPVDTSLHSSAFYEFEWEVDAVAALSTLWNRFW